ncbi:hypothetical protein SHBO111935_23240 [Shigella boydii]|uniref:Uncharacterized protein n=1 Tax=Shigella dysenteriae TaxID=622 RepID=A0A3P6KHP6_SHIDY|nr:Uncharacterised protein [Shigella dysenteriae]
MGKYLFSVIFGSKKHGIFPYVSCILLVFVVVIRHTTIFIFTLVKNKLFCDLC